MDVDNSPCFNERVSSSEGFYCCRGLSSGHPRALGQSCVAVNDRRANGNRLRDMSGSEAGMTLNFFQAAESGMHE